MKAEIVIAKKQRGCSYCGSIISKDEKLIETVDWNHPNQKFPDKKNICFECLKVRTALIPVLESLLKDLKILKSKEDII